VSKLKHILENGFLLTGGPGTGKTTLIDKLEKMRYNTYPEIAKEKFKKNPMYTLNHPGIFFKEILDKYISNYNSAKKLDICFFDRGIPDLLAMIDILPYLNSAKRVSDNKILKLSKKYRYGKVFLLDPLPNYNPKKHVNLTKEQSLIFHRFNIKRYKQLGYDLIPIPVGSVEDRVDMILNHIE